MRETPIPSVLRELETATRAHPLERKVLLCGSLGEGRELLRALGTRQSWLGWEITTPRRLALDLAGPELAADGRAVADAFEEEAVVSEALDAALEAAERSLRELGGSPGFREAVVNAVGALRLARVSPRRLARAFAPNPVVRDLLADVLGRYEDGLEREGLADTADLLDRATSRVASGAPGAVPTRVYVVPGVSLRSGPGRFVRALLAEGATALLADPVLAPGSPGLLWPAAEEPAPLGGIMAVPGDGVPGIELDLFAASGPTEELREVLRRVMAAGLRWDEVEIVATDPVVYGAALHLLAGRLDVPVSYGVGLPVERTGPGRAVATYFRWIEAGYPADPIRQLLETGDLRPRGRHAGVAAPRLARTLRRLRIGRGADRYLPAIDAALKALPTARERARPGGRDRTERRLEEERRRLRALRSILRPVLSASPIGDPGGVEPISPATLARGLGAFLDHVPAGTGPSATAHRRLRDICARVAATLDRPTSPAAARATLRRHLEIRVPAPEREGSAPWTSTGGYLHITDVEHGGLTGRRATFVVGLDADRFPGSGLQDPLLLDAQRRALDPEALPVAAERLEVRRFRLAGMLARLRGRVTLSYSAWDPTEARAVAPSSVLLDAYRAMEGAADRTFEDLRAHLGDPACAVPRGASPLDASDVWLDTLGRDGLLQDGESTVRAAYPRLERGLAAMEALAGDRATTHHGAIRPRPVLDPRGDADVVLSASAIEALGTCPLRYLYRSVLKVRPPDDPELDPERWLSPLDRGRLLHRVYETALRRAREAGMALAEEEFPGIALAVLEEEAERMEAEVPPPGRAVVERELAGLRDDVLSFVRMVAEGGAPWVELELGFGLGDSPPRPLELRGGTVWLRGAVDRVDETDGGLTVVDYKTGSPAGYGRGTGAFDGGRRLQNVIYSSVVERLLDRPVERMEYHFPTRRGENRRPGYDRAVLRRGLGLIDRLFDAVAAGRFLPTGESGDCRFCDYAVVCRVRESGYSPISPRAQWAHRNAGLPEYQELRDVRSWEDSFLDALVSDGPT